MAPIGFWQICYFQSVAVVGLSILESNPINLVPVAFDECFPVFGAFFDVGTKKLILRT